MVCHFKEEMEYSTYSYSWRVRAEFYSKHTHSPMSYMYIFVIKVFFILCHTFLVCITLKTAITFTMREGGNHEDSKREEMFLPISKILLLMFMEQISAVAELEKM